MQYLQGKGFYLMKMRFFLIAFVVSGLVACVSQTADSERLYTAGTYTSVSAPDMEFPANALFSWAPGKSRVYDDPRFKDVDLNTMLRSSIEESLASRGYHVVQRGGSYEISFVAALERALSDAELDAQFGINPGLPTKVKTGQTYEKGTIIIDVSDPEAQRSLWRSAMQGYIAQKLSTRNRKERVRRIVEQMFNNFPQGN